jgi:hypothetical protein
VTRGHPAHVLQELRVKGLATALVPLTPGIVRLGPVSRRRPAPVGPHACLSPLGTGGTEDDAEALR